MRIPIWTTVILLVLVFFAKGIANFASLQTLRLHAVFEHDNSHDNGHHYGHDHEDDDPNDDGIDDHDDDYDDVQSDDHEGRLVHIGRDLTE